MISERHLSQAEQNKKEEIVKAIKRENPGMDKSKAYAIATAQAKKMHEDTKKLLKDIVEELKRPRGRPKKKRNLAGEIVDDDQ